MIELHFLFRVSFKRYVIGLGFWPFLWSWSPRDGFYGPFELQLRRITMITVDDAMLGDSEALAHAITQAVRRDAGNH